MMDYLKLGNDAIDSNRLEQASLFFNKALIENPNQAVAHERLGFILHAQGKFESALEHFSKAIEFDKDFIEAYGNRGFLFSDMARYAESIQDLEKAMELDSETLSYPYMAFQVYTRLKMPQKS